MNKRKFDVQTANSLLDLLDGLNSVVLWVRSLNDQKQLYISQGYERIWGRSCQSLYDYPNDWQNFLIHDDIQTIRSEFFTSRENKAYRTTIAYRIFHADGEPRWILDQSFPLTDESNKPIAIIGLAEMIYPNQWESWVKQPYIPNVSAPLEAVLNNFKKEFKLENYLPPLGKTQPTIPMHIHIENKIIRISSREWEVLSYLKKGYSAKQTAYELQLSQRTIEAYLNNLRKKVGLRNKMLLISKLKEKI